VKQVGTHRKLKSSSLYASSLTLREVLPRPGPTGLGGRKRSPSAGGYLAYLLSAEGRSFRRLHDSVSAALGMRPFNVHLVISRDVELK